MRNLAAEWEEPDAASQPTAFLRLGRAVGLVETPVTLSFGQARAEQGFYGPMEKIVEQQVANGGCSESDGVAARAALAALKSGATPGGGVTFGALEKTLCQCAVLNELRLVCKVKVPILLLRSVDSRIQGPIGQRLILPWDAKAFPRTQKMNPNVMS